MSRDRFPLTRRQLLAGIATSGFAAAGARLLSADAVAYTDQVEAEGPLGMLVSWRETYNGEVRRIRSPAPTAGPGLSLHDVRPGDHGSVTIGLRQRTAEATAPAAQIWMAAPTTASAENGVVEPEAAAGDRTPSTGELQDAVEVDIEYRTWLSSIAAFDLGQEIASGTLADVAASLEDGVLLDPSPLSDADCLGPASLLELEVQWSIDDHRGNRIQTDDVRFELAFYAESCGTDRTNPFAERGER